MSVMIHTGNPETPVMVFADADSFQVDPDPCVGTLDVRKGGELVATFRHWDSAAIVDDADALAIAASLAAMPLGFDNATPANG